MIIRDFISMLNEAVAEMTYKELIAKKQDLKNRIANCVNYYLTHYLNGDSDIRRLLEVADKNVHYLVNFLLMGLMVHEGKDPGEAYNDCFVGLVGDIEIRITRQLISLKYFRELTELEVERLIELRTIYNDFRYNKTIETRSY
jgi:hypothetical protein